ncbi:MAG: hypothetical protein K6F47_05340 [Bacteroidaceae bacterium]|nr:hypothetical protein [Bacteroidaceae bacterium]
MKRQLGKQEIADLLNKFMAGETSLDEENILAQYFRTHEVSDEWKEYKEMFALFDGGTVDIEQEGKPVAKPKIIPFRWIMTGIAASVILLICISLLMKDSEPVKQQPVVAEVVEQPAPGAPEAPECSETPEASDKPEPVKPTNSKRTYKARKVSKPIEEPLLAEVETDEDMEDPFLAIAEQMQDIRLRGEQVRQEVAQLIDKQVNLQ